jgi:hypothetical protein
MRFFKDFVRAVDENAGKHIIDNMCNVRDKNSFFFHEKKKNILHYIETTNMRFSYVGTRSS